MLNRRGRQAPQQDLANPVFSPKNCIQQPSNWESSQNPLNTPKIITDSLLLFCMSASACLIQQLGPTQVSRGCKITLSSTKVLNKECLHRFHNAHNSLRTRHSENAICTGLVQLHSFSFRSGEYTSKNTFTFKSKFIY